MSLPESLYGPLKAVQIALGRIEREQGDPQKLAQSLHQLDLACTAWLNIRREG